MTKSKVVNLLIAVAGIVLIASSTSRGDDKKAPQTAPDAKKAPGKPEGAPPAMTPEQQAEMEAWMKAATPGAEHKNLEYMIGNWDVTIKHWMAPDAPPQEAKGLGTAEWILGGRFARYTFNGDFMGPFEGRGITGYDNIEKKYVSVWADTMSTSVQTHNGTYDAASKTFTFTGEFKDPMSKAVKSRQTIKVVSNDQHVMTFHHTETGKPEQKVMELTYNRAKK